MVFDIVVKFGNCVDFVFVFDDLYVIVWVFDGVDVGIMRFILFFKFILVFFLFVILLRFFLLVFLLFFLIFILGLNFICGFVGLFDFLGFFSVVVGYVNVFVFDVIVSFDNVYYVLGKVVVEDKVYG